MSTSAFVLFSFLLFFFENCYGAPYNYFGIGDGANSRLHALTNAKGRKNDILRVSGHKSINNKPTRGLFYPDDMFVTNWVPSVLKKEDCSSAQPSVKTPSSSKCTLNTKYNEKSESSSPSSRKRSSKFTAEISSSRPRKAPVARPNSTRPTRKQTYSRRNSSKTPRRSTFARRKSTKNPRKSTVSTTPEFLDLFADRED